MVEAAASGDGEISRVLVSAAAKLSDVVVLRWLWMEETMGVSERRTRGC
jgi:hypothetical protein